MARFCEVKEEQADEKSALRLSSIIDRKKIVWPNDGRIALWVAPNIEYFHFDMPIRGSGSNHAPDVPGYTLRDYGSRVGVFRIMEVLDKYGIRASVLLNAEVCEQHPPIIEEGNKRQWEWLGHGMTNSISMLDYPVEEERNVIRKVKEIITSATGKAPKGWLGPAWVRPLILRITSRRGFEYVLRLGWRRAAGAVAREKRSHDRCTV